MGAVSTDTFDQKTPDETKTLFISPNGDDTFDGETPTKPCATHAQALVLAAAKTPALGDPVTVKSTASGQFNDNIVGANFVRFDEPAVEIGNSSATPTIAAASHGGYNFYVVANDVGNTLNLDSVDFVRAKSVTLDSAATALSSTGVSTNNYCEHEIIQGGATAIVNSSSATGISLTIKAGDVYSSANDGTVLSHTGAGATSLHASYIGLSRLGGPATGVIGIQCDDGEVFTVVNEMNCASSIIVNSGGTVNIFANRITGDITVNAGGTLNIFAGEHASGTVTDTGTIHGIIGGTSYGNFVPGANTDSTSILNNWFFRYQFETATTAGAALSHFRVNNADRSLATVLYVDLLSFSESISPEDFVLQFDGFIGIQSVADTSKFILYEVNGDATAEGGGAGYLQIPIVSRQNVGAAFTADETCRVEFFPRSIKRKTVLASFASDLVDHVKADQDAVNQIVARVQVPNDEMEIDTCEVNFYTSDAAAGQMHIAIEDDTNTYWNQSFTNSIDAENTETLGTILVTPAASGNPLDLRILASVDSATGEREGRIGWIRFSGRVR